MTDKQIQIVIVLVGCGIIVAAGVRNMIQTRNVELAKRQAFLDDTVLDITAIHTATHIVEERIERGQIRNLDQLRDAVDNEIAFQKIAIRED